MTKNFIADRPLDEIGRPGMVGGKPAWIIKAINHPSLDEPRFHWLLNADRGWHGWQTPQTYKSSGIPADKRDENGGGYNPCAKYPGLTKADSGLKSRRGYIRIIREDIGVVERDVMVSELKALAKRVLSGRNATIFERHVIDPLADPLAPKPDIVATAFQFGIAPRRVKKIISKTWKKIDAAKMAADAIEDTPRIMSTFTAKRSTGGLSYNHEGRWDESLMAKSTGYSTSINSAASAASTKDIKNEN